ncbi:MAG TPA: hypothetical protein VMP08_06155, partial [Anaerolineae bacterium]|nr:hypothetical protein [Anaerolineae bacterium]
AIQESERSGESRFMDYELLVKAAATYSRQQRLEQSGAAGRESVAEVAISPKPVTSDPSEPMITVLAVPQS